MLAYAAGIAAALGAAGSLILANPALHDVGRQGPDTARAGYVALVDALAADDVLTTQDRPLGTNGDTRSQVIFSKPAILRIGVAEDHPCARADSKDAPDCAALVEAFARRSFLKSDMIDAAPDRWRRDGSRIAGLAPRMHRRRPAAADEKAWQGDVLYRGGKARSRVLLVGRAPGNVAIALTHGNAQSCILDLSNPERSTCGGDDMAARSVQLHTDKAPPLRIRRLADHLLLDVPKRFDTAKLRIDGKTAAPDRRFHLLAPGQSLGLRAQAEGPWATALHVLRDTGLLSTQVEGQRLRNRHLAAFVRPAEAAMDNGSIASSVEADLQFAAQRTLAQVSRVAMHEEVPMRSALVLMDGMTGEIDAAATYPVSDAQLPLIWRDTVQGDAILGQNHAIAPLPVGSAAKVLFGAAIGQAYPGVLRTVVPCEGGRFDSVFGTPLRNAAGRTISLSDNCKGSATGFRRFLSMSSNRYALSLMEYARRRTRLDDLRGADDVPDWRREIERLGCLSTGTATVQDHGCERPLWRGAPFKRSSADPLPPAAHLHLASIENRYVDYYQSILGGNRAYMSLVALAQGYARVVSDRQVTARMTAASGPADATPMEHDPAVWRVVLDGMAGTIGLPHGTAHTALGDAARRMGHARDGYFLLAKTGTPTVEARTLRGVAWRGEGSVLVLVAIRTRSGEVPQRPEDLCAVRVAASTFQDRTAGGRAPTFALARRLLENEPAVRQWLFAPCPDSAAPPQGTS